MNRYAKMADAIRRMASNEGWIAADLPNGWEVPYRADDSEQALAWSCDSVHVALRDPDPGVAVRCLVAAARESERATPCWQRARVRDAIDLAAERIAEWGTDERP